MENKLALISVLFVAALLLFGCTGQQQSSASSQGNVSAVQPGPAPASNPAAAPSGQSPAQPPSLVGTKFSDWKYYSMAQPIAPGPISPAAQAALNVFEVAQAPQADGSLLVTVTDHADGTVSNFTVTSGETLYFSDGNPKDDRGNESDGTLIDDHFVLVGGNSTIVGMLSTP